VAKKNKLKLKEQEIYDELKKEQEFFFLGKEKDYEENFVENIFEICNLLKLPKIKKIERQKRYNISNFSIIIDVIVFHEDDTYSIFEIKCNNKYPASQATSQTNAIGQLLLYSSCLTEIYGAQPRLFLVDQKINIRTMCTFSQYKLPITLLEFQKDKLFVPYRTW